MADALLRDPAIDAETRKPEIVAILSVFTVVSTLAVALRCHARIFMLRCFGPDDAIMVAAQVLTIASAVAIGLGTFPPWLPCPPPPLTPSQKPDTASVATPGSCPSATSSPT